MHTLQEYNPYLYILMRSDLDSMNPGKACAQAAHAANQFSFQMNKLVKSDDSKQAWNFRLFQQWESSTPQGFGTTICLDVNGEMLPQIVTAAMAMGFPAKVTHDPSYPIRDGLVTHLIPLDTCGYVFGDKNDLTVLLGQFDLLA